MKNDQQLMTWKEAFLGTSGPKTFSEAIILLIKGLFMGAANIIPGVSGGTIALITGIYQELILAIRSFDLNTIRLLIRFKIKEAIATIHLRFLAVIALGIGAAILTIARFMNYVLSNYPVYTMSLFFGLIIASILVMAMKTKKWIGTGGISFLLGTAFAYFFVGMIPVSTPEAWWFIFLSGVIAICTMILPGLSGAFFLLIIGKYEYITAALKNPFILQNFIMLSIFAIGCIVGIVAFSRVLTIMFNKFENTTMAALTGIMCGSLRKIWPWRKVLETKIIGDKVMVVAERNVLPPSYINMEFILAIGLMIVGIIIVIVLEKSADND